MDVRYKNYLVKQSDTRFDLYEIRKKKTKSNTYTTEKLGNSNVDNSDIEKADIHKTIGYSYTWSRVIERIILLELEKLNIEVDETEAVAIINRVKSDVETALKVENFGEIML